MLLLGRSDSHAVLLLHLGSHLDDCRLPVLVVAFMAFLLPVVLIMIASLFFLVAGFRMFRMLRVAAAGLD